MVSCWIILFCSIGIIFETVYTLEQRCGSTWQEQYRQLHFSILHGERTPRYVFYHCPCGMSDSLVGIVSTFYYALLSGRAFRIVQGSFDWLDAYSNGAIDVFETENISYVKHRHGVTAESQFDVALFRERNVSQYLQTHDNVVVTTIRGYVFHLFDNPYHKKQLYSMGLRPETAFACGLQYLVKPLPEVHHLSQQLQKMNSNQILLVGIQIRAGDDVFKNDMANISQFTHFFRCAQQIEQDKQVGSIKALWVLLSDSKSLRQQAVQVFGDKIWTGNKVKGVLDHAFKRDGGDRAGTSAAVVLAAAENWMFAICDYFVLSKISGFGRTAAFHHAGWGNIYALDKSDTGRNCSKFGYDRANKVAKTHDPGVK